MNIINTEASVVKDYFGRSQYKITMLSDNIGEEFIKLFQINDDNAKSYLGISFSADDRHFTIWVASNDKKYPLYKGDGLRFKFADGNFLNINFTVGTSSFGNEKRNVAILNERQVIQFIEMPLEHVEILNNKHSHQAIYKFINPTNYQYKNSSEGQQLLQIMISRIAGLRNYMIQNRLK